MNNDSVLSMTRRHFFQEAGVGLGSIALASLFNDKLFAQQIQHHAPKAKHIIYLFMAGAPSQLELFDYKPKLQQHDGQDCPAEYLKGERFAFTKGVPKLLGTPFNFKPRGQSGQMISDLLPHLSQHADDIAIIRSMFTTQFNHAPAQIFMNSGHQIVGRPSLGSWLSYGLGSENKDLPGFVVLISGDNQPDGGKSCWGSGFLPTMHQGVEFRAKGDPVLFVSNPDGVSSDLRRQTLDAIRELNQTHQQKVLDPEINTRIAAYELAYRMQTSVPDLTDISKETPQTHAAYGTQPGQASFANNCLLARRLVERGVRFVQLYHWGWDHPGNGVSTDLVSALPRTTRLVDKPIGALLTDLKQRGLLDETLVIWAGRDRVRRRRDARSA